MKRVLMFIVLIMMPFVLGVEIDLVRDSYYGLETLQAEISGNFISLGSENVFIYEDGSVSPEAVFSGVIKRGEKYYFYAVLPERAGNFSVKIEDVQYIESRRLVEEDVVKDFVIVENNGSVLSINPGFVIAEDEFEIGVVSYGGNQEVSLVFDGSGESQSLSLVDSDEKKVEFSVVGVSGIESNLKIGGYSVPVFLLRGEEVVEVVDEAKIKIVAVDLRGDLNFDEDYIFEIVLENVGNVDLSDVKLSSDLDVVFEPSLVNVLVIEEKKVIEVTLLKVGELENVSGEIKVEFGDSYSNLPLSFDVESGEVIVDVEDGSSGEIGDEEFGCSDIGGEICLGSLKCDEDSVASLDGPCCLGECVEEESGFNWWAIGLLILIVLGIFGMYFYKRMKKKQKPKSSGDILNDKSKRFKKRMKGKEVSKRLDRV
ncbi:hypothetical protein HOE04_00365 [archaeon]|jgi:hypothetical protein|nr:hypothetical protein [archaeon]